MSAALEATDLSVGYGGRRVVGDLDLQIRGGEIVVLLGANGVGKTTTLATLAGTLPPVGGQVRLFGDSSPGPLHRRARNGLAYVPDQHQVFRRLTVKQNLGVGGCSVERALEHFPELGPLLSRRAGLLSGGEQQMLALSRAFSRDGVRLLLADELSLGLAPRAVDRLLEAVRAAADRGLAVLLVEQHVERVLRVADRVCVLARGSVQYEGSSAQARADIQQIHSHYLSDGKLERG